MPEAGWYRVAEDPEGTLRRWNGERWIGQPTRPEGIADPEVELPTRIERLAPAGLVAAGVSIAGFAFLALFMFSLTLRINPAVDAIGPEFVANNGLSNLGNFIDGLGWHLVVIIALVILTSVSFSAWVSNAALASHAVSSSRLRSTGFADSTGAAFMEAAGAFVEIVAAPIERFISSYLVFGRRRADRTPHHSAQRHRPGLFALVNRTIESCDTGPIKALAWWVLLWVPAAIALGAWLWIGIWGRKTQGAMQTVLRISQVVLALEILSLGLIMATIIAITRKLTAP